MKTYKKNEGAVKGRCKSCGMIRLTLPCGGDGEYRCKTCADDFRNTEKYPIGRKSSMIGR